MISDLLPSAGDEKRHTKGTTELQSFTAKQATLTHTHTLHSSLHPFHLPYLPLRATERGVPLLTKSQASSPRESLRRTTPTTTTTTASETFDIHSSSYSHAPSSLPISKKREATTSAFRIPVAGIVWGGKSAPISSAIGRWSPFSSQQDNKIHTQTAGRPSLPRPAWRMYDSLWACSA